MNKLLISFLLLCSTVSAVTVNKTLAGNTGTLTEGFIVPAAFRIRFNNDTDTFSWTFSSTLTANRTYIVPNYDGTLATLAGAESLSNKKLGSLTTNGFVKTGNGDGTLSVDTNTYYKSGDSPIFAALAVGNAIPSYAHASIAKNLTNPMTAGNPVPAMLDISPTWTQNTDEPSDFTYYPIMLNIQGTYAGTGKYGGPGGLAVGYTYAGTGNLSDGVYGINSQGIVSSAAGLIPNIIGVFSGWSMTAGTATDAYAYFANGFHRGGGSITNNYGYHTDDQTAGTNNYGFSGKVTSGTAKWNLYMSGTAQNFLQGNLGIGTGKSAPAYAVDANGVVSGTTLQSTVSTGTAPIVVTSTTNVANLNASSLNGATFAAPGAIGGSTPNTGAFTTVSQTGKTTTYNNIATVSNGLTSVLGTADVSARATAVSATTLYTPTADGMFRISIQLKITTAGTSPVAGPVTITYTDADGSVAQSVVMLLNSTTGTVVTSTVNNSTTTGTVNGSMVMYAKSGVAIQYAIAVSGTFGSGFYTAHLRCEAL